MLGTFQPISFLRNGMAMTVYTALRSPHTWEKTTPHGEPFYQDCIFRGSQGVPIFGRLALPDDPQGTIIATYGITGDLNNQWYLRLLGRKAWARGYGVVLFDWRAHGKTAELSPALTSDGLYEGEDFVQIAAQAKTMGYPSPFWFVGYSLGGQLALWGVKAAESLSLWGMNLGLDAAEIAGGAVISPNLDSNRSLDYLVRDPLGRYIEQSIAKTLKNLAWRIYQHHPNDIDPQAIERANSIRGFDRELVINRLGFSTVEAYYQASSPLPFLPHLSKPTLIVYSADDPLFDPSIIADLEGACRHNNTVELLLTNYGGHVNYLNSQKGQRLSNDPDVWWAWNRVLDWIETF
ncbi:alpha/beta hydrolase fold protein [Rippkaea orientalis PCC 8801]|uniref:Alpha/beta hydrolase fold protein n=1 Tax=Rippkaea orientalis (strain PCC 8801 / RF-1) TaxID=41431 RepID=B7JY09_RIPO1|nr:alpha/beta fold hydrolase [Rippkaea orientalis]ACK65973.1 alpha/beta hydrolase fold protein [Rippkaea orientalis PCC 8801]